MKSVKIAVFLLLLQSSGNASTQACTCTHLLDTDTPAKLKCWCFLVIEQIFDISNNKFMVEELLNCNSILLAWRKKMVLDSYLNLFGQAHKQLQRLVPTACRDASSNSNYVKDD